MSIMYIRDKYGNLVPVTTIQGEKGDKGDTGPAGAKGDKGDTGETGATGATGPQGPKGDKGDTGETGSAGKDGTSVTVASVSESTADGGSNVVTFSDGKTVTIKNGSKGSSGLQGATGATGPCGYAVYLFNEDAATSPDGYYEYNAVTIPKGQSSVNRVFQAGDFLLAASGNLYLVTALYTDGFEAELKYNIRGPQGIQGIQGIQGVQGVQGEKGDPGLVYEDIWDENAVYVAGEVVTHDGSAWVCVGTEVAEGVEPGTDTESWSLLASKGDTGARGATGSDGATGAQGVRGTGFLKTTTAPSGYTTAVDGYTPKYRIELSTVMSQSGVSEVLIGDIIQYSYYLYLVGYMDDTYAYIYTRNSIRGAAGAAGADGATTDEVLAALTKETWTFTLADGSTVDKVVPLV